MPVPSLVVLPGDSLHFLHCVPSSLDPLSSQSRCPFPTDIDNSRSFQHLSIHGIRQPIVYW